MSNSNSENSSIETHYDSESQKSYVSTDQIYSSDMINAKVLTAALNESKSDTFPKPSTSKEILTSSTPGCCRICLQPDFDGKCVSPCLCSGSISKVHKLCLETWLAHNNSSICEICKFKYKVIRIAKYSVLGSVKEWIYSSESREIRQMFINSCLLLMSIPVSSFISYSIMPYVSNRFLNNMPMLPVIILYTQDIQKVLKKFD